MSLQDTRPPQINREKNEEYLGVGVKFSELDPLSREVIRTVLKELPQKLI